MSTKRKLISGGVGLLVVFLTYWAINAQDTAPRDSTQSKEPTKIALVDVSFIFNQDHRFKKEMQQFKNDADLSDAKMKKREAAIKSEAEQLKNLKANSVEYSELEEKIAKLRADLAVDIGTQRRDLLLKEAKIYRENFLEISKIVAKYAADHQIDMVQRFSGNPADSDNPESILAEMSKPVVHYDKKLDITPDIVRILAKKREQAN